MKERIMRKIKSIVKKTIALVRKHKIISATIAVLLLIVIAAIIASLSSGKSVSQSVPGAASNGQNTSGEVEDEGKKGGLFSFFTKKSDDGTSDGSSTDSVEEDPVILAYNANTKDGYMNNCIFLGDSRTVAAVNYGFLQDDNVLAQVGIAHTSFARNTFTNNSGKQYTMDSFLASHPAPVIYLSLGVNGMNGISEEKYESTYEELVDDIISKSPGSNLVIMSIWPVDDNGRYAKSVQNSWINKYNDFLLNLCEKKGIHYLNVNEILTDSEGQMKVEYDAGDGLHYAPGAYTDILEYIIHHPVPGVSDTGSFVVKKVATNNTYTRLVNSGSGNDDGTDLMAQAQLLEQQRQLEAQQKAEEEAAKQKYAEEEAKRLAEEKKKKEQEEAEAAAAAQKNAECNHTYAAATCTSSEKCTKCGATRGSALGHDFAGGSAKNCTRCGAANPNYVAPAVVNPTPTTPEPETPTPGTENPTPGTENPTPGTETPTVDPTPTPEPEPETPSEPVSEPAVESENSGE